MAKKITINGVIQGGLLRVGMVTALVLAIHNFPEGMVTFLAGLKNINVAIPIAFAIAIHNIPEGISIYKRLFHSFHHFFAEIFFESKNYSFICA